MRHEEVHRWFAGRPVYTELHRLTYPPEAYLMLWPLLGWLEIGPARWLWAVTSLVALAWMVFLAVRESGAETGREKIFVGLMVLSMNAVGVTVGNGQLIVHLLPALVSAILLLGHRRASWGTDITAAFLMMAVLIKPTLSLPFVWVTLVAARRLRPFVLASVGYLFLTFLAARFQPTPLLTLIHQWWDQTRRVGLGRGYGNLHSALASLQFESWAPPCALAIIIALGIWTYRRRHDDLWVLMGVAALAARFWSYHRVYDDFIILLPLVALFRIAKRGPVTDTTAVTAGMLLAVGVAAMLAPARMELATPPLNWLFIGGHVAVWLMILSFLMRVAQSQSREY